jgi:hypothetical protein
LLTSELENILQSLTTNQISIEYDAEDEEKILTITIMPLTPTAPIEEEEIEEEPEEDNGSSGNGDDNGNDDPPSDDPPSVPEPPEPEPPIEEPNPVVPPFG